MKVFPGRLAIHCDDCGRDLDKKELAICIGKDTNKFDNDKRQAVICVKCIKKALKMLTQ
jgi:hypothetical protein